MIYVLDVKKLLEEKQGGFTMPSKSKAKGNRFERLCVDIAKRHGLNSQRAWGSDGRSMGEHQEVDVKIEEYKLQCKTRKRVAKWLKPSKEVDVQVVKEDGGEVFVIQPLEKWLEMVKSLQALK
jgi:uncharacterized protein YfaP (DUF2135 family)